MAKDGQLHGPKLHAASERIVCYCGDFNCASLDDLTVDERDVLWALWRFSKYLVIDCPEDGCNKKVGQLCNTPGVWVHHTRIETIMDNYADKKD